MLKRLVTLILALASATLQPINLRAQSDAMPPVHYVPLPQRDAIAPVIGCEDLVTEDFLTIEGAPTRISAAEIKTRDNGVEFCEIRGMIAPQIQFQLHLPVSTYTGRYLQGGCGGACGVILDSISPSCDTPVAFNGAFAVSFNNSGHVGPTPMDTLWAAHAPQLQVDFAYRASHVMAVAAKEVLARYYGERPSYSYFVGCSNGGREGMMEAQRYPDDFDGIVAGAPALWITAGVTRILHELRVAQDSQGNPILTESSNRILHEAVIAACDGLDGLVDGQIDLPRQCRYDPRELVCSSAGQTACLTEQQARVARALYRGAEDAQGRQLFFGGEPYGSELLWAGPGSFTSRGAFLAANQIKFMIYGGKTHQDFNWKAWQADEAAVLDLLEKGGFYNANNPDLSAYKASGGKLIMWQGEADNAAGSHILLDYYQRVRDTMGGFDQTDPFMRVYMLPGVYHCAGGYIGYQHDILGHMVNWVERDEAPLEIVGSAHLADGTVRHRPVYPYPLRASYTGSGDINAAENFVPARPQDEPSDAYDWVGSGVIGGSAPL